MKLEIFMMKNSQGRLYSYLFSSNWLGSALKKDENYYPQVFLKECKYTEKKRLDILLMNC